ncbi:MAG: permease-like cell division protein FtsX [Gammaproteobacteria bacterium]|nr:permease-like cell division protein FtsX [Gammaproteobacteria bacterium]MDH3767576.1 permease-like cell division protein FtsX [Gammaproteobacteria bacterium]
MAATPGSAKKRIPLTQQARAYFLRHAQTMVGALGRLSGQPVANVMTVAVIGIALALPIGLHLLVENGRELSGNWESVVDVSVYLHEVADAARIETIAGELLDWPEVSAVRIIYAEEALGEFAELSGFGQALDALENNPLPDTLVVTPADNFTDAETLAGLGEALAAIPEAEMVQVDTDWVKRFNAILQLIRRTVGLTAFLLALAVTLIVGNTIRLDIENRRGEIEVTKLVGGSDAFVRRPFLYGGLWYGLGGGIVALVLTELSLLLLRGPVARLAGLYGSGFELRGLGPGGIAVLIVGSGLLGWAGSWVATSRHLRDIEPT